MSEKTMAREQAQMPEPAAGSTEAAGAEIPPELEKVPEPTWKKVLKFVIKFGVSAGILTYIICTRASSMRTTKN